jgi:hypothetical protein
MTREQAEEALRQGKKVRHSDFIRGCYVYLSEGRLMYSRRSFFNVHRAVGASLSSCFPLAVDGWEIVE